MSNLFDVLIGGYGDYPQYTLRCLRSILGEPGRKRAFQIHVGCNACGTETLAALRSLYDQGLVDTLIECRENLNKDPMSRMLIDRTTAPYFLWLDDDSHVKPGWDVEVEKLIREGEPFDCAGHVFFCDRSEEYRRFLHKRPWWIGEEAYRSADHRRRVWFPTGGLSLIRTAFFRRHHYPDRAMVKRSADLLLGDLIAQTGAKLVEFPRSLMNLIAVSDGVRRGGGESADGWLDVDPITGE